MRNVIVKSPRRIAGTISTRKRNFMREWLADYYDTVPRLQPEKIGFGRKPAILVVDMQGDLKLEGLVGRAVTSIRKLLSVARAKAIPIVYTVIAHRRDLKDAVLTKLPSVRAHVEGSTNVRVIDELKPLQDDLLIVKKGLSAFLGTNLLVYLNSHSIDTLIITGCHTSGCIRATATDSFSLGFRTVIPEECVGDSKGLKPHKANLCDLHIRGADVVTLDEVIEGFRS
jgi:maleamate amidohydrolase